MEIIRLVENDTLTLSLVGRLDTTTSPSLETVIENELAGINNLVINCERLDYVSSAGLRVLLKAQKVMAAPKSLVLTNVDAAIMEVFEITGFSDFLTIK